MNSRPRPREAPVTSATLSEPDALHIGALLGAAQGRSCPCACWQACKRAALRAAKPQSLNILRCATGSAHS